ncbi:alpha/beta hydrolase [Photobacterium sanctipauli]|uniref:Alpha/beta hydrolase n=1 Tax=Photobacterium sanctipauli TaxID=1342794 RepID=A0A2T3P095_9GAMM|nr:alpha/beta hydrolase-fold protein [Photobacterium sanctipauli]PSW21927.1 alpha/beta hydrolase [Photobacterium sanctipauli]
MPTSAFEKNYDNSRMVIIENMAIPQLDRERTVRIYLPANYHAGHQSYPVLYMHDGQNVFEPSLCLSGASWQAAEHLDACQKQGHTDGIIIVAVDCSQARESLGRRDEYSPWPHAFTGALTHWEQAQQSQGGEGRAYCDFLVHTLKPYIDSQYRTLPSREHTSIAGSSMGGFISLYAALSHPHVFAKAGVFSPAFWFAAEPMKEFVEQVDTPLPIEIYMDIGTNETSDHAIPEFPAIYHDLACEFAQQLQAKSAKIQCCFDIEEGAIHSETAWAKRFPNMVKQFYFK